jgi:hypothetical protein
MKSIMYAECHMYVLYAECHLLNVVILIVIKLSVAMPRTLPSDIRSARKGLTKTNTLAYFNTLAIMKPGCQC